MDALQLPQILWLYPLAGVAGFYLVLSWARRGPSDVCRLPTPTGVHWLWGHEKQAWETTESAFYVRALRECGPVAALKGALSSPDILLIADPGAINHMYSKNVYNYVKSPNVRPALVRMLGRSLVTTEGDQHRRQRHVLAPSFTQQQVEKMDEDIRICTNRMIQKLREHITSATTSGDEGIVNVSEWTGHASMDIIGRVGFEYDFQCGDTPVAKEFHRRWSNLVAAGMSPVGFFAPLIIRNLPWINYLPIKAIQPETAIRTLLRSAAMDIIQAKEITGEKPGKDLVSALIRMKDKSGSDLDEILDQAALFIIAGQETTANTVAFALLELARQPAIQTRLRREISEFCGSGPGGQPTYEEIVNKLPFLDAVCKEAIRMYPAQTVNERTVETDDVIPLKFPATTGDGTVIQSIRVRKGQVVHVPTLAMNRDPTIWGENAAQFDPTRWLDPRRLPQADKTPSGIFGTFTFIEGVRICLGWRLGVYECKIMLHALIQSFEFMESDAKIESRMVLALHPYVAGHEEEGVQLPLRVKVLDG